MSDVKLMSWFGIFAVLIGVAIIILRKGKGTQEEAELSEYLLSKNTVVEGDTDDGEDS